MKIFEIQKEIKLLNDFRLYVISDIHLTSKNCDVKALSQCVDEISDDDPSECSVVLLGDLIDFIGHDDKRFRASEISSKILLHELDDYTEISFEWLYEELYPIINYIDVVHIGNHEFVFGNKHHINIGKRYANMFNCIDAGYDAIWNLVLQEKDKKVTFKIRSCHGAGGATTDSGRRNRLKKYMDDTNADLTLIGHLHAAIISNPIFMLEHKNKMYKRTRIGAICSTFLDTYTIDSISYGERAGYAPLDVGYYCFHISPIDRIIRAEYRGFTTI